MPLVAASIAQSTPPIERRRAPATRRDVGQGGRRITDLRTHPHAYIKVPAFAQYLDVRPKTVMKWIHAGVLEGRRFPDRQHGEWRIRTADAIAFEERARFRVAPGAGRPGNGNGNGQIRL